MIKNDACTINIINDTSRSVNDAYRGVMDDSRVTLQIVASLTDDSRGVVYDRKMLIVQATEMASCSYLSKQVLCRDLCSTIDIYAIWLAYHKDKTADSTAVKKSSLTLLQNKLER
jgi:hypothetical protein